MPYDKKAVDLDENEIWQIVSLHPGTDGACIYLRLRAEQSNRSGQLCLRVEEYAALPFKLAKGKVLTAEEMTQLREAARASTAYQRGVNILGYGANSADTLQKKLKQKGYEADVAARVVETLSLRGYLCEERDACRLARQIMRRGRGLRRILQELRARGYGDEVLASVREDLREENFEELCCCVARKKYHILPSDRQERQKLMDYLRRCGFSAPDIRYALEKISGDEEN